MNSLRFWIAAASLLVVATGAGQAVRQGVDRPVNPAEFDDIAAGKFNGPLTLNIPELDLDDDGATRAELLAKIEQVDKEVGALEGENGRYFKIQADLAAVARDAEKFRQASQLALSNIKLKGATDMVPVLKMCWGGAPVFRTAAEVQAFSNSPRRRRRPPGSPLR